MREIGRSVGENRPLPSDRSPTRRRLEATASKDSKFKFISGRDRGQLTESKFSAQSKLQSSASSAQNPDVRGFPRKVDRPKNASAVAALRSTRIPGPRKQLRNVAARLEAGGRGKTEASQSPAECNKRTNSTRSAKSVSLISNVTAVCRIPKPTRIIRSTSIAWRPINKVNAALQPQSKATSDRVQGQLKAGQIVSQRSQTYLVDKPFKKHPQKSPSYPVADLDRVRPASLLSTSGSNTRCINGQDQYVRQVFASERDASHSSSKVVLQSSLHLHSTQHRPKKVDIQMPERIIEIHSTSEGRHPREPIILEIGSPDGRPWGVPKEISPAQYNATATCSVTRSPTPSPVPCIGINGWTAIEKTDPSQMSKTPSTTQACRELRDLNWFKPEDWQITEAETHSGRLSVLSDRIYASSCLVPNDEVHNLASASMKPNWNVLELGLENDSITDTADESARSIVLHRTSDGWNDWKNRDGHENHLNASDTSDVHRKRSVENINFDACFNKAGNVRSVISNTEKQLLNVSENSKYSVLSTISDFINKRRHLNNSRSHSSGIDAQRKGNAKKHSQMKTQEEGLVSSAIRSYPTSHSMNSQRRNAPGQHSHVVRKQEPIQRTPPPKVKAILAELSHELASNQTTTSPKNSKMTPAQKHFQTCLQPKIVSTSILQRQRREEAKETKKNESKETKTKENEAKIFSLENQTRVEKDSHRAVSAYRYRNAGESKRSKSVSCRKSMNTKTSTSKREDYKCLDLTGLQSQESSKSPSPKQRCKISFPLQRIAATTSLLTEEAKSRTVTRVNRSHGESELKKMTPPEDKAQKGTDYRKVTFEKRLYRMTGLAAAVKPSEDDSRGRGGGGVGRGEEGGRGGGGRRGEEEGGRGERGGRGEGGGGGKEGGRGAEEGGGGRGTEEQTEQHPGEKSSESRDCSSRQQYRRESLPDASNALESVVEKDYEIVVLKSQTMKRRKGSETTPGKCPLRRRNAPVRVTSPKKNRLAALHGDRSGRQAVLPTTKLTAPVQGGCPFKGQGKVTGSDDIGSLSRSQPIHGVCPFKGTSKAAAGSNAKSVLVTNRLHEGAKPPVQVTGSVAKERRLDKEHRVEKEHRVDTEHRVAMERRDQAENIKCMNEELKAFTRQLEERTEALIHSRTDDYDIDSSDIPSSSSSSSAASPTPSPLHRFSSSSSSVTDAAFVPFESRRRSVLEDDSTCRNRSTVKFYKFLPVLSPTQNLLSRIPQNRRDPGEWLRAQTALESHREALRRQPKRTTSETSYFFSPTSAGTTGDDHPDTVTPVRYPKFSDVRFNEGPNLDLMSVSATDSPNFWATLFVEMPTRPNATVYNIKIELVCCALRAFFDPCDRIKFTYVRSVREKLTELIQDGLARPKFEEFVCCERYDCVLVLSIDAGAVLRHPKTSFLHSLSAVLEVEPSRLLILVSTDS